MSSDRPAYRVHDIPTSPEIFASHIIGVQAHPAGVTLVLGSLRIAPDHLGHLAEKSDAPEVFVVGRVVLAPSAAAELVDLAESLLAVITPSDDK